MNIEPRSKILLIDDHEDSREMVSIILEMNGFSSVHAGDGIEALAALDAGFCPDVIILDWLMPGMDGSSFLAALQQKEEHAAIPVVVVSARATLETLRPTTHILTKPIDPDTLVALVHTLCSPSGDG
jgi:CheY-like chemotaxis protein